jgi:hypothetical protein
MERLRCARAKAGLREARVLPWSVGLSHSRVIAKRNYKSRTDARCEFIRQTLVLPAIDRNQQVVATFR